MTNPSPPADRRRALKARHREAILTAATALMDETSGVRFSVDELAERANVSRRTVFNHFGSLEEIVNELFSGLLSTAVDTLVELTGEGTGGHGASAAFEELAAALQSADLVAPMAYLTRCLEEAPPSWRASLMLHASDTLGVRIARALAERHPDTPRIEIELVVSTLLAGVAVLREHWVAAHGPVDTPASRAAWSAGLSQMVAVVRRGYPPTQPGPADRTPPNPSSTHRAPNWRPLEGPDRG